MVTPPNICLYPSNFKFLEITVSHIMISLVVSDLVENCHTRVPMPYAVHWDYVM